MVRHKTAPEVRVFVDGRVARNVHCLDVTLGSGMVLPQATLEVEPVARRSGRRVLNNITLARINNAPVEVVVNDQVVHWGKALAQAATADGQRGDAIQVISRMDEHLFGDPLLYAWYYQPLVAQPGLGNHAAIGLVVFNPDVDGVVTPNMSSRVRPVRGYRLFIHHGSIRTGNGAEFNGGTADYWTLPRAVHYLCHECNLFQRYVYNPTPRQLAAVLPSDPSLLRNYVAPIGSYLPEQLDRILSPFGFNWTVDFEARGRRRIRIFERGKGRATGLKLQSRGADLNMQQSNVEALSVTADVSSRAFNQVHVVGDYEHYESTFTLQRAWPEALDDHDPSELTLDHEEWQTNPRIRDIWRKWVLNEAGDYNGLRPGLRTFNFSTIAPASSFLPHRRRFEPCLTLLSDGSPVGQTGGVYVEWWDDQQSKWLPATDLDVGEQRFLVLDDECGIYFSGQDPPFQIRQQKEYAQVRVTATVVSDRRIHAFIDRRGRSLITDAKAEIIDCGKKYKFRQRLSGSRFFGQIHDTSEVNDTEAITALATQLITSGNTAIVSGNVTLTGVDHDFSRVIGRTIGGIQTRRVSFNVSPAGAPPRYPTVIGAKISFVGQKVDFTLDTFREPVVLP